MALAERDSPAKHGLMAAKSRTCLALTATAILWSAAPARAQEANEQAPANTVGPSELQNFNLEGTVTRRADPPPAPAPAPSTRREPPPATTPRPAQPSAPPAVASERAPSRDAAAADAPPAAPKPAVRANRPSVSLKLPPLSDNPIPATADTPAPALPARAPSTDIPWPWLLAALALVAGGGAYWWTNRARPATAGGPATDSFAAPPPQPAPVPAPVPAAPPRQAPAGGFDPASLGIVSTRLRPWVEIDITPVRCVVDGDNVSIEFELVLFNSGNLPARSILLEAAILNAGTNQDHDIGHFFANPVGTGKRASSLPPLTRLVVRSQIATPLKDARQFAIEGRLVYVPIITVNVIYKWPAGEGQTGAAYLVGRETHGAKLAPFRLDRGGGAYQPIAGRRLDIGVRS